MISDPRDPQDRKSPQPDSRKRARNQPNLAAENQADGRYPSKEYPTDSYYTRNDEYRSYVKHDNSDGSYGEGTHESKNNQRNDDSRKLDEEEDDKVCRRGEK